MASSDERLAQRRYTAEDIEALRLVQDMRAHGFNYEHVSHRLSLRQATTKEEPASRADMELAPSAGGPPSPALTLFTEAVHTIADGQQLLLNSQQASREVLNVVLRDNFSLKEENARLRERMMRLEQELSETRRRAEARLEMLERRLERLETAAHEAHDAPFQRGRGWLARLLGL